MSQSERWKQGLAILIVGCLAMIVPSLSCYAAMAAAAARVSTGVRAAPGVVFLPSGGGTLSLAPVADFNLSLNGGLPTRGTAVPQLQIPVIQSQTGVASNQEQAPAPLAGRLEEQIVLADGPVVRNEMGGTTLAPALRAEGSPQRVLQGLVVAGNALNAGKTSSLGAQAVHALRRSLAKFFGESALEDGAVSPVSGFSMGPVESGWLHFKASSWAKLGRHKAPLVKEEGPISAASVKGVQPAQAAALSNTAKLVVAAKARLAILVGKLAAKWHQLYGKKQLGLGVDISAMDKTVRPQDDFFRYVNGTWLKNFKMPADKSRFGVFDQLIEAADIAVRGIIEEVSAEEHAPGTDQQRIADFYKSFLNTDAVEAIGLQSVDADLRKIERIKAKEELTGLFAQALSDGIDTPVGLYVDQDAKNPSAYITGIQQSGLGLPDREYYFKDDEATEKIRAKYLEYVTTLFSLSGEDEAEAKAKSVFALEKALAQHHWTQEENRDVGKTYNKRAIRDLGTMAGGFDWGGYLRAVKIRTEETEVVVAQPSYFAGFAKVLADQPLKAWKLYMKARTLDAAAPFLPKAFVEARFEYMGRTLSGQPEMEPRWKRGVGLVNGALGELVGRIYVEKYFPESSRKRMKRLVENLRAAYAERIQGLDWMGQETKEKALEKLRKFTPKIGYPDKWRDYSRLEVKADDLLGNVRRSNRVDHDRMVSKLGQPMDRGEWYMTPQTVSAYYNAAMNEIVFPAAFLQAPFFNPDADDAVNYGAIGGAIGHEMSHGFDDVGAQFDGDGMLRNWWTPQDKDAFEARAAKLVDQYDAFEPLPGVHVNGKLTLGENIGDLGGLTVAFRAYQLSLRGKKAPVIEGFTGEQRFFLGWAQVWRSAIRDEMLRLRIGTDPHSPAQYRVNGVVRNMPEFYEAENVREGDKLFLSEKDRVGIW